MRSDAKCLQQASGLLKGQPTPAKTSGHPPAGTLTPELKRKICVRGDVPAASRQEDAAHILVIADAGKNNVCFRISLLVLELATP